MKNYTIYNFEQRSEEWDAIRVGKVGGSEAIELTTDARTKTLIVKKVSEIQTGEQESFFTTSQMQEGIDNEPIAKEWYEKTEFQTVTPVGYVTNVNFKGLGLSPDGLVLDTSGNPLGAVEIKCPQPKAHCAAIIANGVPTEYKPQLAQTFLLLEDIKWIDFIIFNAKVKSKPYFKVRIMREEFQDEITKIEKGYLKYITKFNEALKLF
jgi:hypothetical protein